VWDLKDKTDVGKVISVAIGVAQNAKDQNCRSFRLRQQIDKTDSKQC